MASAAEERRSLIPGKKLLIFVIVIVLILVIGLASYFFLFGKKTKVDSSSTSANQTVEKVAKLIQLPSETPTIATVSDISKLKDQPFFANAKNGDVVLIYSNSKKAYLYRPSENKLIEVSAYNPPAATPVQEQPSAQKVSPTPAKTYKVAVLNGTKIAGLASKTATKIEGDEFTVVSKGDSIGNGYTQTIVVDLGGGKTAAADLAVAVNGKVDSLPKEEKAPANADFLVIVGQ